MPLALRSPVPCLLMVTALGGLAGCGSSSSSSSSSSVSQTTTAPPKRTVDQQQVEQGIENSPSLQSGSITVTKASCPADVPVQVGGTFTCTVTWSNGATGKVTVTQQSANHYTYTIKSGSVQIPGSAVDAQIEKQLAAEGIPNATVTCPQNIVVKVGTTVTCDVSGAQGVAGGTVTFTFSNAEGEVDTSSVKTS